MGAQLRYSLVDLKNEEKKNVYINIIALHNAWLHTQMTDTCISTEQTICAS